MTEEQAISPDYQTGFNEGYIIAKYSPELAGQLANINEASLRLTGFQEGRDQFINEQTKERLPSWLKGNRFEEKPITPNKSLSKGKDKDIEPEP
jgi:hypothetical protein